MGGEWKPRQIDNPDYKGPWVHPEIDNPEYNEEEAATLGKFDEVCKLGFDLWQVKSGTIFDNIMITDDPEEAKKAGEDLWAVTKDAESKMRKRERKPKLMPKKMRMKMMRILMTLLMKMKTKRNLMKAMMRCETCLPSIEKNDWRACEQSVALRVS